MDGYRWPRAGLLQIKSPKKPIKILVCPCEESTDEHSSKVRFQTGHGRLRWRWAKEYKGGYAMSSPLGQAVR